MDPKEIKTIGYLSNLQAGTGGKNIPGLRRLISSLPDVEFVVRVPTLIDQIRDALRDFISGKRKVDMIVIDGGDGTIQKVITIYFSLFDTMPPPILPIRGGSMNVVAHNYNYGHGPVQLIKQMMEYGYELRPHPLLRIMAEGSWGSKMTFPIFGSMFSVGAATEMLKWYCKGKPGVLRALQTVAYGVAMGLTDRIPRVVSIEQQKMPITVAGRQLPQERVLICLACTVPKMMFGATPFPKPPGPEKFAWLAYSIDPIECAKRLPKLFSGKTPKKDVRFQSGATNREMTIRTDRDFTLDGEVMANLNRLPVPIHLTLGPTISIVKVLQKRPA